MAWAPKKFNQILVAQTQIRFAVSPTCWWGDLTPRKNLAGALACTSYVIIKITLVNFTFLLSEKNYPRCEFSLSNQGARTHTCKILTQNYLQQNLHKNVRKLRETMLRKDVKSGEKFFPPWIFQHDGNGRKCYIMKRKRHCCVTWAINTCLSVDCSAHILVSWARCEFFFYAKTLQYTQKFKYLRIEVWTSEIKSPEQTSYHFYLSLDFSRYVY